MIIFTYFTFEKKDVQTQLKDLMFKSEEQLPLDKNFV